jgi:hypothetical protein
MLNVVQEMGGGQPGAAGPTNRAGDSLTISDGGRGINCSTIKKRKSNGQMGTRISIFPSLAWCHSKTTSPENKVISTRE